MTNDDLSVLSQQLAANDCGITFCNVTTEEDWRQLRDYLRTKEHRRHMRAAWIQAIDEYPRNLHFCDGTPASPNYFPKSQTPAQPPTLNKHGADT